MSYQNLICGNYYKSHTFNFRLEAVVQIEGTMAYAIIVSDYVDTSGDFSLKKFQPQGLLNLHNNLYYTRCPNTPPEEITETQFYAAVTTHHQYMLDCKDEPSPLCIKWNKERNTLRDLKWN